LDELDCVEAEVIGVSGDSVQTHKRFQTTHQLKFSLLSDTHGGVARRFGVPLRVGGKSVVKDASGNEVLDDHGHTIVSERAFTAERWTFIVGKNGRIVSRETTISPVRDSQEVLDSIRTLDTK
jgi:peroxiredoxin Q/BCP